MAMSPLRARLARWIAHPALDALLLAFLLSTPVLGAAWVQSQAAPDAPTDRPSLPDPVLVQAACEPVTQEWRFDCYMSALTPILASHGLEPAFEVLEVLSKNSAFVFAQDHPLAHELGRQAARTLGDAPRLLSQCPFTMASGCFHGVLEGYLSGAPHVTREDVRGLCRPTAQIRGEHANFQCLHGLGHGLTMYLKHELFSAITYCDALEDAWSRESCHGGAFMENIVSYQVWAGIGPGEGAAHRHTDGEEYHGWIYREDPHYPCNRVAWEYKRPCYTIQTAAYLSLFGWNIPHAFSLCDSGEPEWIETCYLSMGRDLSPYGERNGERVATLCAMGNDRYDEWCVFGAVKDFINSAAKPDAGFPLCKAVADRMKARCYQGIGEIMIPMLDNPLDRWKACGMAEPGWADTCRAAARI